MTTAVFASTFAYPYAKLRGREWVHEALKAGDGYPGARTFHALGRAVDGEIRLFEESGTLISVARDMAAAEFLASGADVWVTWDDDVESDRMTLRRLVLAARSTKGLVGAPGIMRSGRTTNFMHVYPRWDAARIRETEGGKVYPVLYVALSLAAIHRDVVQRVVGMAPWWKHHTGRLYPGAFLEGVQQGQRIGEDVSFCLKMSSQPDCPCLVLLDAPFTHAGDECFLGEGGELRTKAATVERLEALQGEASPETHPGDSPVPPFALTV